MDLRLRLLDLTGVLYGPSACLLLSRIGYAWASRRTTVVRARSAICGLLDYCIRDLVKGRVEKRSSLFRPFTSAGASCAMNCCICCSSSTQGLRSSLHRAVVPFDKMRGCAERDGTYSRLQGSRVAPPYLSSHARRPRQMGVSGCSVKERGFHVLIDWPGGADAQRKHMKGGWKSGLTCYCFWKALKGECSADRSLRPAVYEKRWRQACGDGGVSR